MKNIRRTFWVAFLACMILFLFATYFLIRFAQAGYQVEARVMTPESIASRLKPVGQVVIGQNVPVGSRTGKAVYDALCFSCHAAGLAGAPKMGDVSAWQNRINKGFDALVYSAIHGLNAMPARGGDPKLTDNEVARAVAYLGQSVGAKFVGPAVVDQSGGAEAAKLDPQVAGKRVYESICMACHASGVAGSPKFGDPADWEPHLAKGFDAMYASALKGLNAMPPKGGHTGSEEEFKAAVIYLSGYEENEGA